MSQIPYSISEQALSVVIEESKKKYPNETGGILVGRYDGNELKIEMVIGPGPNAAHAKYGFRRDGLYSQENLDQIVIQSLGEWDYLGEWHSHPQNVGPSTTDINSLRRIASNPKYAIKNPILGLSIFKNNEWGFYCFSA